MLTTVLVVGVLWLYARSEESVRSSRPCFKTMFFVLFCFFHHFYFPAQFVGGFTLSDLPDKPWSQVSSLLPPGTCLQFLSRIGFSISTSRRFSSNVANSCSRAFREYFFMQEKVPTSTYVHSVRIEPTKLILVGTRITYQATGDAGSYASILYPKTN